MFGIQQEKSPNRLEKLKVSHPKLYEYVMKPVEDGGLGYKEIIDWINNNSNMDIKYQGGISMKTTIALIIILATYIIGIREYYKKRYEIEFEKRKREFINFPIVKCNSSILQHNKVCTKIYRKPCDSIEKLLQDDFRQDECAYSILQELKPIIKRNLVVEEDYTHDYFRVYIDIFTKEQGEIQI